MEATPMNAQVQLARTRAASTRAASTLATMGGRAVALTLIAAVTAACGSAAAPGAAGPAGGTSPPAAAHGSPTGHALTDCAASELRVTLDTSAAGVAAGSSYVPLEFTNASGRDCQLSGYPAVTFASSAGGPQIGTAAAAEVKTSPVMFTLAPGGTAHAWLQIADVASYPASQCRPAQASGLRVGFSGAQAAAFLPHSFQACTRAVPGATVLAVFPVESGQARRGTAP
jgi:Protein of unknown function (DUF4232)